jgi:hypothetical protein
VRTAVSRDAAFDSGVRTGRLAQIEAVSPLREARRCIVGVSELVAFVERPAPRINRVAERTEQCAEGRSAGGRTRGELRLARGLISAMPELVAVMNGAASRIDRVAVLAERATDVTSIPAVGPGLSGISATRARCGVGARRAGVGTPRAPTCVSARARRGIRAGFSARTATGRSATATARFAAACASGTRLSSASRRTALTRGACLAAGCSRLILVAASCYGKDRRRNEKEKGEFFRAEHFQFSTVHVCNYFSTQSSPASASTL